MIKRSITYNKLLFIGLVLAFIAEIAGLLILLSVDWRIALGAFLLQYAMGIKKANRHYESY